MPTWCIVRGCSNSSRKPHCKHLSWHSFPTQDEALLTQWLLQVDKKEVNKNWKICSEHFDPKVIEKTLTGRRRLKKGAVPTIFKQQCKRKGPTEERQVAKKVKTTPDFVIGEDIVFIPDENQESSFELDEDRGLKDATIEVEKLQGLRRVIKELKQARIKSQTHIISTDDDIVKKDVATSTTLDKQEEMSHLGNQNPYYFDRMSRLKAENEQLRATLEAERKNLMQREKELEAQHERILSENKELKKSIEAEDLVKKNLEVKCNKERDRRIKAEKDLENSYFLHKNLCKTPKLLYYYTGFDVGEFEILLSFLGISACEHLSYEHAGQSFTVIDESNLGRPRAMKPRDQLLLVLCRIKMAFSEKDLAVRFHISQTQVSRTCTSLISRMQNRFKEGGIWQDNDQNDQQLAGKDNVPDALKTIFPKIKSLIEGMKIYLPKSKKGSIGSSPSLSMVVPR